jgi:hypothetical protein
MRERIEKESMEQKMSFEKIKCWEHVDRLLQMLNYKLICRTKDYNHEASLQINLI